MKQNQILRSAFIIITFLLAYYGRRWLSPFFNVEIANDAFRVAYAYAWWILPTLLVTGLLWGFKHIPENLGVEKGIQMGIAFASISVAPMFIGSALIGTFNTDISMLGLLKGTLFAGLMEEYLFRGFLFGLLFRKLGWGFVPSALLGAIIFGFAHIYQGNTLPETAGVFFVTAIGAMWFAWLYIEWNNNLWIPIFLHFLMNLSWTLFEVSPNALGGISENIFRIITIIITVILTIHKGKRDGRKINDQNFWIQKPA